MCETGNFLNVEDVYKYDPSTSSGADHFVCIISLCYLNNLLAISQQLYELSYDRTAQIHTVCNLRAKQVSKVIWQKAASPSSHFSRRRMHSYAACCWQAHSSAAAGEQCAMHSCVATLQWAGTCTLPSNVPLSVGGSGSLSRHSTILFALL